VRNRLKRPKSTLETQPKITIVPAQPLILCRTPRTLALPFYRARPEWGDAILMNRGEYRMKKLLFIVAVAGFMISTVSPAFAIKQLNDQFKVVYAGDKATEEFKKLVADAKCNVCHVDKENKKKVRNPYGTALHEALEKDEFPVAEFKKEPEKFAERLNAILKKIEEEKSGDPKHETFSARMKANLLPGGNIEGKKD
jgi:hypothetical protein